MGLAEIRGEKMLGVPDMGVAKGIMGINPPLAVRKKNGKRNKKISTGNSTSDFGHKDY